MTMPTAEELGRLVREVWVDYAIEQGDTKPSHLIGWDDLGEYDKEVDRRIGAAVVSAWIEALAQEAEEDFPFRDEGYFGWAFVDWLRSHLNQL